MKFKALALTLTSTLTLNLSLLFVGLVAQPASAACQPSATQGFATGSAISANQVLVCATESKQSTTVSASKPTVPTKSTKPTLGKSQAIAVTSNCPTQVRTTEQIVAATLAGCAVPGPSTPPVRVVVSRPGKPARTESSVSASSQSAVAALSARALAISASQQLLRVGEAVVLSSDAAEHEKTAVILGRLGFVRFTPVAFEWTGETFQSSPVAVASFATPGIKSIALKVTYSASTRFSLSENWSRVGEVAEVAAFYLEVGEVKVGELKVQPADPISKPRLSARLVSANCEVKPSSYRC